MNEYVKSRMEQLKHTVDLIKGSITEPWDLALYTWRVSNESKKPEDIAAYEEAKKFCIEWYGLKEHEYQTAMKSKLALKASGF